MSNFLKRNRKYFYIGIPVLLVVLYFLFGRGRNETEAYVVKVGSVEQSVTLSGKVEASDKADLGFAASGRIAKIFVKNNQPVVAGQTLAQLEIGDLLADLRIKELNAKTSDVDLADAKENLERVTAEENGKVESAYRKLLSEGLELVPESNDYDVDPPTISGLYDGQKGQYKVIIDKESATSSDFKLFIFNLEKIRQTVYKEGPTPFGTKGLYVSFPDDLSLYQNTTWFLDIPNKTSSSYLSNYNAYNEATKARDLAIKSAEFKYQKALSEKDSTGFSVAQAEINKIRAEIRKNTIYAPFKGTATNVEKEVGESASVGEQVISVLGDKKLEVVLQVSELDVSKLSPDQLIEVSIDSIPGETFKGVLTTINSRETEIDGVPVYEAFVELEPDPRIKNGMTATGTIILAQREGVLVVPNYLINKVDGKNFVEVTDEDGNKVEKEVTLGLSGTDSMVEVISGLEAGEQILGETKK